jgi:putative sterol carrier protein
MEDDHTVAEFTAGMQNLIAQHSWLDATIKIVFEDESVIYIDGKSVPHTVTNEDRPAEVTLRMSLDTLNKLYRRELNPAVAAMTGKIKVEGNLMVAMKLDSLLQPPPK